MCTHHTGLSGKDKDIQLLASSSFDDGSQIKFLLKILIPYVGKEWKAHITQFEATHMSDMVKTTEQLALNRS
jgi:hypothetical protein